MFLRSRVVRASKNQARRGRPEYLVPGSYAVDEAKGLSPMCNDYQSKEIGSTHNDARETLNDDFPIPSADCN